jgi:hypothetical protein
VEVSEGKLNSIRKIEISWRMNIKNQGYIISGIIELNNYINIWMKDENKMPRSIIYQN